VAPRFPELVCSVADARAGTARSAGISRGLIIAALPRRAGTAAHSSSARTRILHTQRKVIEICSKGRAQPNRATGRSVHSFAMSKVFQANANKHVAVQCSHVVCVEASVWAICNARQPLRKKHNVSCSIRDSRRLFDLALHARGFRSASGRAPQLARHTVLERSTRNYNTFCLLAGANANLEPAYSE
jgi:hypothetical protein